MDDTTKKFEQYGYIQLIDDGPETEPLFVLYTGEFKYGHESDRTISLDGVDIYILDWDQ